MFLRLVITLDGPAGSGKSTLAKALAAFFNLPFLDTGLLYRAVAKRMHDRDIGPDDLVGALAQASALQEEDIEEGRLHGEVVGQWASAVAALPEVRALLLPFQQLFAEREGGAVLAGRDTGTVICPAAPVKLFIEASLEARARRRFKELRKRDDSTIYERVLSELQERDERDLNRAVAPLRAAPDAIVIDTTELGIDDAIAHAETLSEERIRALLAKR